MTTTAAATKPGGLLRLVGIDRDTPDPYDPHLVDRLVGRDLDLEACEPPAKRARTLVLNDDPPGGEADGWAPTRARLAGLARLAAGALLAAHLALRGVHAAPDGLLALAVFSAGASVGLAAADLLPVTVTTA